MISGEFIEATSRLEKYFEKSYTTEQLQIMYEELKNLSIDRYKQIIAKCIRDKKFLPKIADILEINNELMILKTREEVEETEKCSKCNSKGFILYQKRNTEVNYTYTFACRCTCKNANNYLAYPSALQVGIVR